MKRSIFVLVLLAIAAIGCSGDKNETTTAAMAPWEMLPEEVDFVMHVDMKELQATELYREIDERYGQDNPLSDRYVDFVEKTGIDPKKDIDTFTFAAIGDMSVQTPPFYGIIRGSFDRKRADDAIRDSGEFEPTAVNGLAAWTGTVEQDGKQVDTTMGWLDDSTMLVATNGNFGRLVDSATSGKPGTAKSAIGEMLQRSSGQFFAVFAVPQDETGTQQGDVGASSGGMTGMPGPFKSVRTVLISMNANSGLDLAVHAETASDTDAGALQAMLQQYVGLGKMFAADEPELGAVLDRLSVTADGRAVSLSLSVGTDELLSAMDKAKNKVPAVTGG